MAGKSRKCVLITGGSRGIGTAICLKYAKECKAPIIFTYNSNEEKANEVLAQMKLEGANAYAIQCDIRSIDSVKAMYKSIRDKGFWVHTLINNAGITQDKLAIQMDQESWTNVMKTNVDGTFNCIKSALTSMMAHKVGVIVNMASVAAIFGQMGQSNYCASKGAVISLTKSLARELGPMGIRVNCIAPGFIDTDMVDKLKENQIVADHLDKIIDNMCPLQRIGQASEVANVVYFLAHRDNSYMTGQTLVVDGGMTMQ
jgi:3-oxoacyl-[acyl-carrier protein] reductase